VEEVDPAAVPVTEGAVGAGDDVPLEDEEEAVAALASARYPARSDFRVFMVERMSAASASRSLAWARSEALREGPGCSGAASPPEPNLPSAARDWEGL
jgi:hypothetical protein